MKKIKLIIESIRLWICLFFVGIAFLVAPSQTRIQILTVLELYKAILLEVKAELDYLKPKERHLKVVEESDNEEK